MKEKADVFTLGVLVGAVEGNAAGRFGSLFGFDHHAAIAQMYGVVDSDLRPTPKGEDLYQRHGLERLPLGRAYLWHNCRSDAAIVDAAIAELNEEVTS